MSHNNGLFSEEGGSSRTENLLSDLEGTVSRLESSVDTLAQSVSGSAREPEHEALMWPKSDTPRSDFSSFDLSTLSGTLAPGVTEFDFETGTVSLSDVRAEEMTNNLRETNEDCVRTVSVAVDGPCLVYIPSQNVRHYINEPSKIALNDIEADTMQIQSWDIVSATVFAGTHPDMEFEVEHTSKQFRRISWNSDFGQYLTVINPEYDNTKLSFTTQEETMNEEPISSENIPVSNLKSFSLNALNLDSNNAIEVSIQGRNTLFDGVGGGQYENWTPIDGWSEESPMVVDPQTQKGFVVDDFPYRLMRVRARCADPNEQAEHGIFTLTGDV